MSCFRCTTPKKCAIWGCCPNTWPAEKETVMPPEYQYETDQWWFKELDSCAKTPDQRRALHGVVHGLMTRYKGLSELFQTPKNPELEKALTYADTDSLKALARQESDRAYRLGQLLAAVLTKVGPVELQGEEIAKAVPGVWVTPDTSGGCTLSAMERT